MKGIEIMATWYSKKEFKDLSVAMGLTVNELKKYIVQDRTEKLDKLSLKEENIKMKSKMG